ncbi:hypothetical protein C8F01DRAFT_1339634, partial [Mycena amicta]
LSFVPHLLLPLESAHSQAATICLQRSEESTTHWTEAKPQRRRVCGVLSYSWFSATFDTTKFSRSDIEAAVALIVTDIIRLLDDSDSLSGDFKGDLMFDDNPVLKTRRIFRELDQQPRNIPLVSSFLDALSHFGTLDHTLSPYFVQFKSNPRAFIAQFSVSDDLHARKEKICIKAKLIWHGLHKLAAEVQLAVPTQFGSIFKLLDQISDIAEMYMDTEKGLQTLMDNMILSLVQANTVFLEREYYSIQVTDSSEKLMKLVVEGALEIHKMHANFQGTDTEIQLMLINKIQAFADQLKGALDFHLHEKSLSTAKNTQLTLENTNIDPVDSTPSPIHQESPILVVNDVNDQEIHLSTTKCMSWEDMCNELVEHGVQALSDVKENRFILLFEDPDTHDDANWKSKANWSDWMLNIASRPAHHRIVLWLYTVRHRCMCGSKPLEDEGGSCKKCRMRYVQVENVGDERWDEEQAPPMIDTRSDTSVPDGGSAVAPTTTDVQPLAPSSSISFAGAADAKTTAVDIPAHRSVVLRHRGHFSGPIQDAPQSAHPIDSDHHSFPPPPAEPNNDRRGRQTGSHGKTQQFTLMMRKSLAWARKYMRIVYIFMTVVGVKQGATWDSSRLERRASMLLTLFLVINGGLLSIVIASLALSDVANSPVPQTFIMLVGICALFACGSSIYLAYTISDCREEFSEWFINHKNLAHKSESLWDLETMIALPNTWTAWAFLYLVVFAISFVSHNEPLPEDATTAPGPKFTPVQWTVWGLVFAWSSAYSFKIYLQMRQYGGSFRGTPQRRNTADVEHGTRQD